MSSVVGTESVVETTIGTTVTSFTTSFTTTITETSSTTPQPTPSTTPPSTFTSVTSIPPTSTVFVPPSSATENTTPSVVNVTETITQTASSTPPGVTTPITPSVVVVTSTFASTPGSDASTTLTSSSASSTPSALSASGSGSSSSSGLSTSAKIAIAVVIPIVAIAAAFFIAFFLWRKRKAKKNEAELRKSEMAEYGFNPNSDPTLGVAGASYTDGQSEAQDDTSGYRGWGATSSNRKASTTLGSNGRGLAMSDSSSQPGGMQTSPNTTSDAYSADPLMNGHPEGADGVAALGAAAAAGGLHRNRSGHGNGNNGDIRRGPSNASSAYSSGHQSDASSEPPMPGPYYQEEVPYNIYNDASPAHGPYGDGSYGGTTAQPVIRDNQARRNTRIEQAPAFRQGQGGIAQNF